MPAFYIFFHLFVFNLFVPLYWKRIYCTQDIEDLTFLFILITCAKMILNIARFKSIAFLFVFCSFHLSLAPFFPLSFCPLLDQYFMIPLYLPFGLKAVALCCVNVVVALGLTVYIFNLLVYLQVIVYDFMYRIGNLQRHTSVFPFHLGAIIFRQFTFMSCYKLHTTLLLLLFKQ